MQKVRVRYGPSPTGIPHIGNIRTALFNFLFAKNQEGKFFLRIEDTDQARIVPGAVEKIKESLKSLNLTWDEDIIFQSKRLDIYQKYLNDLKSKGFAYEDEGAWRFKIQTEKKSVSWQDVVHGPVEFPTNVIEDFIIIKSDGFPTYHFASVVDDHLMEISHVMRGDEWISSTPKHLLLYEALGWQHPQFVHLPPILGADHKKLSKREGAKSVLEYIDEGYLSEAIVNFLALLGWSPKGNQEIFSLNELKEEFSLDRINKNSPIFNIEKLGWFNQKRIIKMTTDDLALKLKDLNYNRQSEHLRKNNRYYKTDTLFKQIVGLSKERIVTLREFYELAAPIWEYKPVSRTEQDVAIAKDLEKSLQQILNINWTTDKILEELKKLLGRHNVKMSSCYRIITGREKGLPLPETLEILGKDEVLKRISDAIKI